MKSKLIYFSLLMFVLSACGEYSKILKSDSVSDKFEYAKKYFGEGKYTRSATLLEEIYPLVRTSTIEGETVYMLARSYYELKDYLTASEYFKAYYTAFPRGEYAELARYYSAYGLYLDSPDPRLDQADTYTAMRQFNDFIDMYPTSEYRESAMNALFEMNDKLALKELMAARLYYDLGDYTPIYSFPGGNYLSCVITARNAIQQFPSSKYREEFMYYTFMAKYEMAIRSVEEKKDFRYRDVVDEYRSYVNDYPEGRYLKEIQKLYANVAKELEN